MHCDVVILATGFKPTHTDWLSGVSEFASGGGDGRGGGGLEETAGVSGGGREVYRSSHGSLWSHKLLYLLEPAENTSKSQLNIVQALLKCSPSVGVNGVVCTR